MRLIIELGVEIAADGTARLPTWNLGVECPVCASTDVVSDPGQLLTDAVDAGAVSG